ncbi:uncharacterized protein LOC121040169 isoform X5 [Herpailurus yagouaroundi]|uniref:uncharacterized protein LOC121040169 isoform X5 n=1 Tax=Herpailurus yagouaroundi TaxID=1608482 RepID=UPI001AD7DC59|nr:uncharacterized protein LOC121040169 isoform X5 [Puma yagouaroundi]
MGSGGGWALGKGPPASGLRAPGRMGDPRREQRWGPRGLGRSSVCEGASGPVSWEPGPAPGFLQWVCPHFRPRRGRRGPGGRRGSCCSLRHSRLVGQLLSAQQDEGSHLSPPWRVQAGGPPPAGHAQARVTWRWRPGAVAAGRGGFCGVEKVPSGSSPRGCGHANRLTPASRHLVLQVTPDVQTTDRAPPSGREAVSGKGLLSTVGLPRGPAVSHEGPWTET